MVLPTLAGGALLALSAFAKGPYLQELGADGVTIRLELATAGAVRVEVTADDETASKVSVASNQASAYHALRVGGLRPQTTYRYVARAGGATESGRFTTAPDPASRAPFSFLIYGDNRSDPEAHAAVVRAMSRVSTSFFLHTGDFVADGSDPEGWQTFFDVEHDLLRDHAVFGCVGNHELMERSAAAYLRFFGPSELPPSGPLPAPATSTPLPPLDAAGGAPPSPLQAPAAAPPTERARLFWTFRWSNARFFLLNAFDTWVTGDERAWLARELARAKDEPNLDWRIAVLHHAPWSSGPHGNNARLLSAGVQDLLAQYGVDLVVGGHDHIYERGQQGSLRYIVSGGGGAPLYRLGPPLPSTRKAESAYHFIDARVTRDAMAFTARRIDGTVLEACGMSRGKAGWDCDPARDPPATAAPTPSARAPASRCGCSVPGGRGASGSAWLLALTAILFGGRRAALGRPRGGRSRPRLPCAACTAYAERR